jgi:hypothetical protein
MSRASPTLSYGSQFNPHPLITLPEDDGPKDPYQGGCIPPLVRVMVHTPSLRFPRVSHRGETAQRTEADFTRGSTWEDIAPWLRYAFLAMITSLTMAYLSREKGWGQS